MVDTDKAGAHGLISDAEWYAHCVHCADACSYRVPRDLCPVMKERSGRAALRSVTSFYVLSPSDVGRAVIRAWGRFWPVSDFLGRILPGDVGKRVYVHRPPGLAPVLQVENEEQRARRAQRETHA